MSYMLYVLHVWHAIRAAHAAHVIHVTHVAHGTHTPRITYIAHITHKNQRSKLAEIIIDLDKIDTNMESAYECVRRLEEKWINSKLKALRESLKNVEDNAQDPISIMKQIDELQKEKNKLSNPSSSNEV